MINLKGLATGIGSLPLTDAQTAVDLVLRYLPGLPFWPQLPKRDFREGMLVQFSENLPGLKVNGGGLVFTAKDKEKELELFYDRFLAHDLEYFKISPDFAAGLAAFYQRLSSLDLSGVKFIKCQVTGPFTFCSGISDAQGRNILHDDVLRQAMVKGLSMKALWQLEYFKKFGKEIIMFFDEPYLTGVGSAYTPVNRSEVIEVYSELADTLKSQGSLIGIHCCGNTDWSMLMDSGIDIINFDAFNFQERFVLYAENLSHFLKQGGIICWGIVPTREFKAEQNPEFLVQRIKSGLDILVKKGVNRQLLLERLLISPACGLGTLDPQKAAGILNLLDQTSLFIRENL
ncbi:MAG: methionine synthase [Candidatus Omnitrophica bacterium CG11_big_fil_rev_8_21_14_0_20_43_6]|nr:MAG: methionine synthase [Candidatus Omnitrophica bacterium CG11_big_fil_rev_8_21_14_0_20_43_6]